jgi:polyisoprenoid-binding protein YceI
MALRYRARTVAGFTSAAILLAAALVPVAAQPASRPALAINTARISIAGTSNVHAYTASTTTVRLAGVQVGGAVTGAAFWEEVVKPGALEGFEIAVPAATLHSDKDGLDKNMHKALKVQEHADITFRLVRLEAGAAGTLQAVGVLRIAGVTRDVTLTLKTVRKDATLTVTGELPLLMTDYGITPPKAMLGMLKTDPKIVVTFEVVLSAPLT